MTGHPATASARLHRLKLGVSAALVLLLALAAVLYAKAETIVLGAEGSGLRPAVANACAELACIPIASAMESLNVSNAAAIAFYEASRGSFPAA